MGNLLFISHRFPYPPDRGEKIRIWHLIQHLAKSHRIFLGCLSDDPRDAAARPMVAAICAGLGCFSIDKRRQKLRALAKIRPGRPLMLDYYDDPGLRRWIAETVARERIDVVYIFSTAMAPYGLRVAAPLRILDMVDVDSAKWSEYAQRSRFPTSLIWAREGRTLLAYERSAAMQCDHTFLVTEAECRRFADLAPETSPRLDWLENGVDLDFFDAAAPHPDPYPAAGPWLALVGNMDYPPNADAAEWFAHEVMPILRRGPHSPRLAIVGAGPGPQVQQLAQAPDVLVTGRVEDVRPYLAHATAVVAPLRIARGVQNKVLEGMAMGRPVIASPQAFEGILAEPDRDLLVADGAEATARRITEVLDHRHEDLGNHGRVAVEQRYAWSARLATLDRILLP